MPITAHKIFVVGIGGIGVSGLALLLKARGSEVSGSDLEVSEIISKLQKDGILVAIGHRESNLPKDCELIIYSSAVPEQNPERAAGKARGIPELSYGAALGEFSRDFEVIAVAGTNGKTTTTAMIAKILEEGGLDPTAIVGSLVLDWGSNSRLGQGPYFVLEADEYRRAFLNFKPKVGVITNIASDHLDYYHDLEDIKSAFAEFASRIKPGGTLIYNLENENTAETARKFQGGKIGFKREELALSLPGKFNQANASAAAAAARTLGIPDGAIKNALKNFRGTWRRFELIGRVGECDIISDYAHHPAGIKVTLEAADAVYRAKKVLVVFQPHQHNRTKMLFRDFVRAFCQSTVHDIILTEIFDVAGREEKADQNVSSRDLVKEIAKCRKNALYCANLAECEIIVSKRLKNYDAVLFMGAGDIYKIAEKLAKTA